MFEALKKKSRNNTKQITAWVLFGMIILVFIFWGLTPRNQSISAGGPAAQVNSRAISLREYAEAVENLRRQYPSPEGVPPDQERQRSQQIQQMALEQLVNFELLEQGAQQNGFLATDAEVRDTIAAIKEFQENGRFQRERYQAYLTATSKTAAEFEDEMRRQLVFRKAQRTFSDVLKPLPMEVTRQKELSETKTNVEFASMSTENLVKPEMVTEREVKDFMAKPDSEKKLKEYFDVHKQDFNTQEQVHARHILIKAEKGNAEAERKALAKIKEIQAKLKTEDFGKLAKANSEDPGSKTSGGDLGFFSRGKMVPEFEQAAFSLAPNQVSEPIKTDYGYHLIQVLEKKGATQADFNALKPQIAKTLVAQEKSKTAIDEVREAVKTGKADEIGKIAAKYKLKWEETGPFSIETESIPHVGANDEFLSQAFTLSAEHPYATQLVRQGPTAYIL